MFRVFLVEDSAPVRQRVAALLGSIKGVTTVGSAATARDAERGILVTQPDAVVLDIRLAQGSGFDLLRALRAQLPQIEVYVLSNFIAPAYRQLAAKFGVRGFFDKSIEIEALRRAIAERAAQSLH